MKVGIINRAVMQEECPWLSSDLPEGAVVYSFAGFGYGSLGEGIMVANLPDQTTNGYELPIDAIDWLDGDQTSMGECFVLIGDQSKSDEEVYYSYYRCTNFDDEQRGVRALRSLHVFIHNERAALYQQLIQKGHLLEDDGD